MILRRQRGRQHAGGSEPPNTTCRARYAARPVLGGRRDQLEPNMIRRHPCDIDLRHHLIVQADLLARKAGQYAAGLFVGRHHDGAQAQQQVSGLHARACFGLRRSGGAGRQRRHERHRRYKDLHVVTPSSISGSP